LPRHRYSLTFFGVFFSRKKKATTVARRKQGFHDSRRRRDCKRELPRPGLTPAAPTAPAGLAHGAEAESGYPRTVAHRMVI